MALSSNDINKLDTAYTQLTSLIGQMHKSWNTFQWVVQANQINQWATGTTIGEDTINSLRKQTDNLKQLEDILGNLIGTIHNFTIAQARINKNEGGRNRVTGY